MAKKKAKMSTGKKVAIGASIAAVGVAAEYFLGPKGKQNRAKAKAMVAKAEKKVASKIKEVESKIKQVKGKVMKAEMAIKKTVKKAVAEANKKPTTKKK
jgi:uncharacterized protein HemX